CARHYYGSLDYW
nr:immunoglobulin heavy chain junction region [Mus musculus]